MGEVPVTGAVKFSLYSAATPDAPVLYVSTNGCCSCGPNTPHSWAGCLGDRLQNRMPLPETRFPILEVVNRVSVWFGFCSCFDAHYMPAKS